MTRFLRSLLRDQSGAVLVEYTVLLGLMLAVSVLAIASVGNTTKEVWRTGYFQARSDAASGRPPGRGNNGLGQGNGNGMGQSQGAAASGGQGLGNGAGQGDTTGNATGGGGNGGVGNPGGNYGQGGSRGRG